MYVERLAGFQALCRLKCGHFQSEKNRHAHVVSGSQNRVFIMSGGELLPDFVFRQRLRCNWHRLKKKMGYISCCINWISFIFGQIRSFSTETAMKRALSSVLFRCFKFHFFRYFALWHIGNSMLSWGFFDGESNCYAWVGYHQYSKSVRSLLDLVAWVKPKLFNIVSPSFSFRNPRVHLNFLNQK